jgi:hypothetical protein
MTRSTARQTGIIGGSLALLIMLAACGGQAGPTASGTAVQTPDSVATAAPAETPAADTAADPLRGIATRASTPIMEPVKQESDAQFAISEVTGIRKHSDDWGTVGDPVYGAAADGKVWLRLEFGAVANGSGPERAGGADVSKVTLKDSDGTEYTARYVKTHTDGNIWQSRALYEVPADEADFTVDTGYKVFTKSGETKVVTLGAQRLTFEAPAA